MILISLNVFEVGNMEQNLFSCFQMIQITTRSLSFLQHSSGLEDNSSSLIPVYHEMGNQTRCRVLLIRVKYILESLWNGSPALKFRSCRDTESRDESISWPAVFLYFPVNICILVRPLRHSLAQHFLWGNEGAGPAHMQFRSISILWPFDFQVKSYISRTYLQFSFL